MLFIAGMGGLLYGIDIGIIAGALPYLESTASLAWKLSAQQLGFIVAAVLLGSVLSSLFAGALADLIGRRWAMALSGLLFTLSIPLIALADGYTPLLLGRLLQGVSGGLIGVVVPLYLAECLHASQRGRGAALFQLLLTIGLVAAAVIGLAQAHSVDAITAAAQALPDAERAATVFTAKDNAWRSIFWMCLLPGIVFTAGALLLAESPRWLVSRGRAEDAAYLDRRDIPNGGSLADVLANEYLETVDGNTLALPYLAVIRRKLPDIPINIAAGGSEADLCFGIIQERLSNPCLIELIWSYWLEEGMLVQTMNAITQRFQNLRPPSSSHGMDPLANSEIDMLRPLNNLLWGYTQDEQHRLTVMRRNYEYDHHYGVRLDGKAVQHFRPADSRSKFLEAFHHLLRLLTSFYRQDDDTTVKADAFPVLNALKEVHLILSQGAHNQFGDLPSTARIEMLMQQWLLGRPEFREFLPTRVMVAYPEPWMDRVDAMKKLQGWTDTSVMHFRSLAMFGEQLLLSIRYGNWSDIYESTQAFNWARFWRPQAQGYIHAYRAATGVDLSVDGADAVSDATLPSVLLRQRLAAQQARA
eukprot:gene29809-36917_t